MAQLTTDNINTIAAATASMGDDDYLYIYKADGQAMGRITKAQLLQGINQSSGGMSAAIYQAIQTNVEVLRLNFNALSSALANLAFSGDNPNLSVGEFNWPEQESGGGGDTPTPTDEPTITFKNGSGNTITTLNVGEIADGESSVSNTFFVYGTNLTDDITLSVTNGRFDVLPTTIPMNNAASGVQVTITYSGNSSLATDYVVASSNGATSKTLVATATKDEGQQGGDEPTPSQSIKLVHGKYINQYGVKTKADGSISSQYADLLCCLSVPIDVNFGEIIANATEWGNARIVWTHGQLPISNCYLALYRINQAARTIMGSTSSTSTELNSSNITGWANLLNSGTRANQLTATFLCESNGNGGYKVVDGCSVVLYDGNGNSWQLISASDLQNAEWVDEVDE